MASRGVWLLTMSFLAATCVATPPTRSADEADPDGEITTAISQTPLRMDPQLASSEFSVPTVLMMFEGLMTFEPSTLKPVPAAAKDFPTISADGLMYTFTLRDGLRYSDGSPLTARDFAYALTRLCDPALAAPYALSVYAVAGCEAWNRMDVKTAPPADVAAAKGRLGVRANGDRELVVTLREPASYFTSVAGLWSTYPVRESDVVKAGEKYGTEGNLASLVGNGPFKLVEWEPAERIVFERNPYYRMPAKLKRWTRLVIPDPTLAFAAYRNNEIDLYNLQIADLGAVGADAELRSQVSDYGGSFTGYFALNVARAPFDDIRVRQAVAKAIDREGYARDVVKIGRAAHSLIPPGHPGHDAADDFQKFDLGAARELLRSSRYAGTSALADIKFVYGTNRSAQRTPGEWLQQQLKRNLGIDIAVEGVDRADLARVSATLDTAPHIRYFGWAEDYPDPQDWLTTLFHSSSANASSFGYKDPKFDELVTSADRETDALKRADLYQRASRLLSEDAAAVWLVWLGGKYLQKPRVKGVTPSADDFGTPGFWRLAAIYVGKKG